MTDGPDGRLRRPLPADTDARRAERERQHQVLADLLGAYADGELPAESVARVEAHLVGCARCRGDLAMQVALRDRLAAELVLPASAALRVRLAEAVAAAPAPVPAGVPGTSASAPVAESLGAQWRRARVGVAAVLAAVLAVGWALWWGARAPARPVVPAVARAVQAARVPLVAAVLADYRRVAAGDLPGHARDLDAVRAATGLPVEPLRAPDLHLLAAWTTALDDETVAVLAYRRGDHFVLHYIVPEPLYFRHSALRAAAAAHRPLTAVDGAQAVVAWSEATAGALLVGDDDDPARLLPVLPGAAGSFGKRPGS